jgi:hypothetical protein
MTQRSLRLAFSFLLVGALAGSAAAARGRQPLSNQAAAARVSRVTGSSRTHYRRTTPGGYRVMRSIQIYDDPSAVQVRDRRVDAAGLIRGTGHNLVPRGIAAVAAEHLARNPSAAGFTVEFAERFGGLTEGRTEPHGKNLRFLIVEKGGNIFSSKQGYLWNPETREIRAEQPW